MRYGLFVPNLGAFGDCDVLLKLAFVTPLARRRPWKVARETATLDRPVGEGLSTSHR